MDARFAPVVRPSPEEKSGYSGTTVHYYVGETEPCDDAPSLNDEVDQRSLPARHQPTKARDVDDVIRRHTLRRYREEVEGGLGGGLGGLAGVTARLTTWDEGNEGGHTSRTSQQHPPGVKSIPPLYKTPTKKKASGGRRDVSDEPRRKGKKASPRRRGRGQGKFGFLGNLFSSGDGDRVQVSIDADVGADLCAEPGTEPGAGMGGGQTEQGGNPQTRRPPKLVVGRNKDCGDGMGDGSDADANGGEYGEEGNHADLVSPLMQLSPGLSCGGLLDEKFVEAMRGAENAGSSGQIGANDGDKGAGMGGGRDGDDDALLQALSPRSLLASPRVMRRLSGASVNPTGNVSSAAPTENAGSKGRGRRGVTVGSSQAHERTDATKGTSTGDRKAGIDRSYDEEHVYQLMQQVKSQQAKILELEEKATQMSAARRHDRSTVQPTTSPPHEQRQTSEEQQHQEPAPAQAQAPAPGASEDPAAAKALLSQMDDTLSRIKAESDERIRRAESQHASNMEGVQESFEAKLKLAEKTWDDERVGLLKMCAELEESNKETGRRLESMTKDKVAMDELLQSMRQKVTHLEEQAASAEQRVGEAMRQRALVEDTSMALANQIATLTNRVHSAEKIAESAQQELQIQQAAMKTRVSTVESLNQEIQRLTRENSRLIGDKSSMEEHVRRLTSILHTVMTPVGGGGMAAGLKGAMSAPVMSVMGGPVEISEQVDANVVNHGEPGAPGELGGNPIENDEAKTTVNPSRQPLVPRNTAPTKPLEKMTPLEAKTYKETRTVELDKEIMNLNVEKEQLEQELARMPFNSGGKTVAQRRRKKLVESRLDELIREIGTAKRELRSMKRDVIV